MERINGSISHRLPLLLDALVSNSTAPKSNGFNMTNSIKVDEQFFESYIKNRAIEAPWYHLLIIMYSVLIVFGALGNSLVVVAVLRKPIMRTARNLFILNLAISDLLLCLVTMPLTLMEIISKYWPFGSCSILCKTVALLQGLSIFVSTISITAIAFDRYQVIVYPTRNSLQFVGAITILACIWLLALLLASPLFIFKEIDSNPTPKVLQDIGMEETIPFCIEDWPSKNGRFYYSIFSLCVQYLMPILIVSAAYFGIYNKLKNRITVVTVQASAQRKVERGRRMKRTNCLLISIAIIFGVSWLPLNFYNLYADSQKSGVSQLKIVLYAICHMIGMSSACSNPLLYGWLNDNFRSNVQAVAARRRRKHQGMDMSKGELKLLGHSGPTMGDGAGDCGTVGLSTADTNLRTGQLECGLRSMVTESVALTENPMATEATQLMPRSLIGFACFKARWLFLFGSRMHSFEFFFRAFCQFIGTFPHCFDNWRLPVTIPPLLNTLCTFAAWNNTENGMLQISVQRPGAKEPASRQGTFFALTQIDFKLKLHIVE